MIDKQCGSKEKPPGSNPCGHQILFIQFCYLVLFVCSFNSFNSMCVTWCCLYVCLRSKQTYKLDGVPRTQTSRLLLSYYSSRSHGTVCTTTCKRRNYCIPRDPASRQKMATIPDDCERTATVALPTAASPGLVPTTTAPLPPPLGRS